METIQATTSEQILSVGALRNGTIIDHIPAGNAMKVARLLQLQRCQGAVVVCINLPSTRYAFKDLIKIADWCVGPELSSQIASLAPCATVNIVNNYQVIKKYTVHPPEWLNGFVVCPNRNCISNHEPATTRFHVDASGKKVRLRCSHCERTFWHHEIEEYLITEASAR
jgi:aspartate carbamoyltransferase regulatory subunit